MRNWSISKLADIIRGTPKPQSGTSEEWNKWEDDAFMAHPLRYEIVEVYFDKIEDIIFYIPNKINDIIHYYRNRYLTKSHTLTSNLSKGCYHELDDRIIFSLFDELVNFVEVEKAYSNYRYNHDRKKTWFDKFRLLRSPEAGLNYLDWETTLVNDFVEPTDPLYNTPTEQAKVAMWVIKAYKWWKYIRPFRPDPHEVSGWSAYCDTRPLLRMSSEPEDRDKVIAILEEVTRLENQYNDEDTEMLIQLIKYRNCLWT
jgi:hypothetical protein